MARTQLLDVDQAPITAQQYFADGDTGPIVAALATVPELLGPTLTFVGAASEPESVRVRAKLPTSDQVAARLSRAGLA